MASQTDPEYIAARLALRERVRDLWNRTPVLSTAAIGRKLGITKNAVVGIARRINLEARESPIKQRDPSAPPKQPKIPRAPKLTLPKLVASEPKLSKVSEKPDTNLPKLSEISVVVPIRTPPKPVHVAPPQVPPPVLFRRATVCCWPIGEPGTLGFRMCDDTALPGRSYCLPHCRRAYPYFREPGQDAAD
jgi:GcrA cell cycle regulator